MRAQYAQCIVHAISSVVHQWAVGRQLKIMSIITVQLGQCGNQIGRQLFSTLREDALGTLKGRQQQQRGESAYYETSTERFFVARDERRGGGGCAGNSNGSSSAPRARAVLVDMESKAVQQTLVEANRTGQWHYDPTCVYVQKRGSGNNWANGYHSHGPKSSEHVLEMIQTQAEQCDYLSGFLILMSVAGGTGSGVGAYLTECIKDAFPSKTILNTVVWPYLSGEVIVQDYNAILTTGHLQKASDTVIILQNDQLHKACSKLLLLRDISLSDINRVISHSLAGILQPSVNLDHLSHCRDVDNRTLYNQCLLQDIQTKLCPLPDFKLLSLKSVPQMPERSQVYTRYLWPGLLKHMRQMLVCDAPIEEGMDWSVGSDMLHSMYTYRAEGSTKRACYTPHGVNKSLANLLVARGRDLESIKTSTFSDSSLYCRWVAQECAWSIWGSRHTFDKYEKSCTLLSNSQGCVLPLDTACRKAWQMYTSRAYVHQYLQNGLSEQDFMDCFVCVEQALKSYATIQ